MNYVILNFYSSPVFANVSEAIQIDIQLETRSGLLRYARKDGWVCNENNEKLRIALIS